MAEKRNDPPSLFMMRRRHLLQGVAAGALVAGILPGIAFGQDATSATEISPATPLADVPRDETLVLGWSITSPIGVTNPWAVPGYTHQEGNAFMWEPLMYFGIFADNYIPWLAESMEYTADDFTALQIKLNPAAKWSDGTPVTAKDVVFTFEGQMDNDKLPYHAAFQQFLDTATATDDHTVDVKFKIPGTALQVRGADAEVRHRHPDRPGACARRPVDDVNAYAGGTEMPHSGPYDLVAWNADAEDLQPPRRLVGGGGRPRRDARGQAHHHLQSRRPGRAEHGHRRPAAGQQRDGLRARHAQLGYRQHPGAEPQDHHPYRQRVALRLSRLVAELALDEHPARPL